MSKRTSLARTPTLDVREDPSGELREALARQIGQAGVLESQLYLAEGAPLQAQLEAIERWRQATAVLLGSAFEQEAVSEFLHATSRVEPDRSWRSAARIHRSRIRDALELLQALQGTLDARGVKRERSAA